MVGPRLRAPCARCALRTDYCDFQHDRAEYPGPWPFECSDRLMPHLEALPASRVLVSACSAGHDVYSPDPQGPCADFVALTGRAVERSWLVPRSLADHVW